MKFLSILILGAAGAATSISCAGNPAEPEPLEIEEPEAEHAPEVIELAPVHGEAGLGGMVLNDGERWQMDEHTRTSFAKMATSFLDADPQPVAAEDLKAAGANLNTLINELIMGCTMIGPGHDQLHVYLVGYMPAVAALASAGRTEDAETVTRYLEAYDEFFE